MLGVFLLPAFTRLGHECQDLLSPCNGMHVCTDWTSVCTLIRKFWGNGVRTHVNSKGKIPSTSKLLITGRSNPPRCIKQDSKPNTLPAELFRPRFKGTKLSNELFFNGRVVALQNHGEPIRDEMRTGLQRYRSLTDQAYLRWLESSLYRKLLHKVEMCCLACVSSVRILDARHVSPSHGRAAVCAETWR